MSLRVRPEAQRDISDAIHWYQNQRDELGREFRLQLEATFQNIEQMPHIYPNVHAPIKRALVTRFPYSVYYILEDDAPIVIAVMHTRRDPRHWLQRL